MLMPHLRDTFQVRMIPNSTIHSLLHPSLIFACAPSPVCVHRSRPKVFSLPDLSPKFTTAHLSLRMRRLPCHDIEAPQVNSVDGLLLLELNDVDLEQDLAVSSLKERQAILDAIKAMVRSPTKV